jgi:glyceraldehyde-3-phosphate dehydrogenase (NADP+)
MKMFMGGKPVDRPETIDVINPFDGSVVDTVPKGSADDIKEAIGIAVKGYEISRKMPAHQRIAILYKASTIMEERQEELARIIAQEGSKTINEARGEARRAIITIRVSAEEARRIDGESIPFDSSPGAENKVGYYYRFPIGVIGCITPFNDPLNLVAHKLGPAIAGGNSVVLKPATVTPLSALLLGEILLEAGLPGECLSVITGYGGEIGEALVTDPRVRMISFTGGVEAGEIIASKVGMKKVGMELGSNAPVIVMNDCDLPDAVESCVSGAFWAVGQNCIGVQRIFVHNDVYDQFRDDFVARTKKYKVGYQLDEDTDMGPMIEEREAERVIDWVKDATDKGATLLTGGTREGTLVQPTVLENMPADAILHKSEVFGPTVTLYRIDDLETAIEMANDTEYGLHGAIFTNDVNNSFRAIRGLDVGSVMVNESTDFRIDQMPFGGVKKSGLGREGIKFALQEMTEPKVVCFNLKP